MGGVGEMGRLEDGCRCSVAQSWGSGVAEMRHRVAGLVQAGAGVGQRGSVGSVSQGSGVLDEGWCGIGSQSWGGVAAVAEMGHRVRSLDQTGAGVGDGGAVGGYSVAEVSGIGGGDARGDDHKLEHGDFCWVMSLRLWKQEYYAGSVGPRVLYTGCKVIVAMCFREREL